MIIDLLFQLYEICGLLVTDSVMGGNPGDVKKGQDNGNNDGCISYVLVPIPSEDLSLDMSFATDAKFVRLYIWNCLVGNRSQFDCILCRLSCKLSPHLFFFVTVFGCCNSCFNDSVGCRL